MYRSLPGMANLAKLDDPGSAAQTRQAPAGINVRTTSSLAGFADNRLVGFGNG